MSYLGTATAEAREEEEREERERERGESVNDFNACKGFRVDCNESRCDYGRVCVRVCVCVYGLCVWSVCARFVEGKWRPGVALCAAGQSVRKNMSLVRLSQPSDVINLSRPFLKKTAAETTTRLPFAPLPRCAPLFSSAIVRRSGLACSARAERDGKRASFSLKLSFTQFTGCNGILQPKEEGQSRLQDEHPSLLCRRNQRQ